MKPEKGQRALSETDPGLMSVNLKYPAHMFLRQNKLDRVMILTDLLSPLPKQPEYESKWEFVVGRNIAKKSKPVFLSKEGILKIAVADASYMMGIKARSLDCLSHIHILLGHDFIRGLDFFVDYERFRH